MSAPFLPLFNLLQSSTAGLSSRSPGSVESALAGAEVVHHDSFVQAMARMQQGGELDAVASAAIAESTPAVSDSILLALEPDTLTSHQLVTGVAGERGELTQRIVPWELEDSDALISWSVDALADDPGQAALRAFSETSLAAGSEPRESLMSGHDPLFSPLAPVSGPAVTPLPVTGAEVGSQPAQLHWMAGQQPWRPQSHLVSGVTPDNFAERGATASPSKDALAPPFTMELGKHPVLPVEERSAHRLLEERQGAEPELKSLVSVERPNLTQVSSAAATRVAMPVQVVFGQPQWATAVAERTAMLASQNIQHAELKLDPPELGPLNVRVSINQEQASVHFISANPSVREALDQSVARLRELLQEQGLELVDTGVSDQAPQRDDARQQADDLSTLGSAEQAEDTAADAIRSTRIMSSGIDDFV